MSKIITIIPALNEEKTIGSVVEEARKHSSEVLVINDGSNDNTARIAQEKGAIVYSHIINRGVGGALKTGFRAALLNQADIIVMLDADGQHDPSIIPALIQPLLEGSADAVLGSRLLNPGKMPFLRRFYNKTANFITFILFGVKTTDSQSGLRAFSQQALGILELKANGPEICSEIIKEIGRKKLRLKEIPIEAIYTEYSMSKGQNMYLGIKTFIKLILTRLEV